MKHQPDLARPLSRRERELLRAASFGPPEPRVLWPLCLAVALTVFTLAFLACH